MCFMKAAGATEESKKKWLPCFQAELMSSEESCGEDESEDGQFVIRPLVWRSEKVTTLFTTLDEKYHKHQSIRSKKMSFTRKDGLPSDRLQPTVSGKFPDWLFKP